MTKDQMEEHLKKLNAKHSFPIRLGTKEDLETMKVYVHPMPGLKKSGANIGQINNSTDNDDTEE